MVGEKCGLTVLALVNAQSIMHIVFHLCDVLRFDPTVVIHVLINKSSPKLNKQIFFISKLRVHAISVLCNVFTPTRKTLDSKHASQ